jgi:hypothetical protein
MADCEVIAACPFFNDKMNASPSIATMYKRRFCQGDSSNCARLILRKALGKEKVPADLYPNETERAHQLIDSK